MCTDALGHSSRTKQVVGELYCYIWLLADYSSVSYRFRDTVRVISRKSQIFATSRVSGAQSGVTS